MDMDMDTSRDTDRDPDGDLGRGRDRDRDRDRDCCSEPCDSSPVSAANHGGDMAIVPALTLIENHLGDMAVFNHRVSMQALLKERLKEKLKAKLKPQLRLNYFKHRQECSSILPWVAKDGVPPPSPNGDSAAPAVEPNARPKQFSIDVAPLKMLPAGVKIELDVPAPFLSLGREPSGELVVRSLATNGRKKTVNKTSQFSRVNRFADSILQFVGERSVPEKLIRGALGNNPDISKAIRLLLSEKKLKRLGDGGKGCAYVYVRTDLDEPKAKTKQLDMSTGAISIEREFVRELERRFPATNVLDSTVWNVLNGCRRMQGDRLQCDA